MKRKELIKIINSIVLTSYILNISPVMAMDDEASDIFSFEDIIEEENVTQPEDNCDLKKEETVSDDLNNDNEIFNDDNFVIDLENDMKSEGSDLKKENDIIISDTEGGVPLDNDLISEDVSEEYKDIEEYDDVISSEIEDNWLNREVARQVYSNGDRYTDLTDDDYLKITTINLSNKGLSGKIPEEIGKLTNLKDLRLYNNNLSGSIPEEIGNLRLLEKIGLQDNSLSGAIPESIGNLTKLIAFDVYNNKLSGSIPESIGNLTNLDYLSLDCNNLTGSIPESIGNLTSLQVLTLQYNNLTGSIPKSINSLSNLRYLYLNNNKLVGSVPDGVEALSSLQTFVVSNNRLSGEVSENLINKFTTNSFKSNFLNDVPNQNRLVINNTDKVSLKINESLNIDELLNSVDVYNEGGTCIDDSELDFEVFINEDCYFNEELVATIIGETSARVKLAGTDFMSENSVDIIIESDEIIEDNWVNREVARQVYGSGDRYVDLTDEDYLKVTQIYIYSVSGGIPDSIGKLKNLKTLKIGSSDLSEGISEELGTLTLLEYLDLYGSKLEGEIPSCIFKLTNLSHLDLSRTGVTGIISEDIGNLNKLEKLLMYANKLEGELPESIGNLTKLVRFDISDNKLNGRIPESIGNLVSVKELNLSDNNFSGEIPESIGSLKNLFALYLDNNYLSGEIPESICDLDGLLSLCLYDNCLLGEIPESISNLNNLSSLDLSNNYLTGKLPSSMKDMTKLAYLYLNDNNLSGEIDEDILNLPNLQYEYASGHMGVMLFNNNFTGDIPENIKTSVPSEIFENNLFNNVENQKYIELTEADDIVLELGEKASIPTVDENITIYNYDGTIYGDGSVLNYSFEYEYDRNILDDNFIGIDIGSSNIIAKMSGTEIVSKNSILVEVRDTVKPNIDATVSTRDWTTGDVEIYISTEDNDCVEKVILPDGSESRSNNFVCTVSENGEYTFIAVDRSGNTSSVTVVVNNIDREMPSIQLSLDKSSWTNGSVGIKMVALDDGKISKVILPDGSESKLTDLIYNVTSNGDYEFIVVDGAGNTSKEKISVKNIDNKKPIIKLSASNVKADNSIDITVIANDDESGIENIEMSDGTKLTLNNNIINVKKNGIYKFVVTDKAGNVNEGVIEITNIIDKSLVDKEAPVMSYILSESDKTNKDVLINVMAIDNKKVDYIVNPDGSKTSGSASIYKVDKNGKYKFEAVDTSGNKSEIIINISNIDKEGVSAFVNQSELLPDDTVDLVLNLNKAEEEIKSIKVNGTVSIDVNSPTLNVDKNGTYQFFVEDKANNTTIASTKVDSIPFEGEDFEKPVVNYLLDTYSWVNDSVGICVYASDNQGIKSIRTPDGDIVEDSAITYIVEDNGVYEFEVEDLSGNIETLTVDISNIDKVSPFARTVEEEDKNDDKTTVVYVNLEDEESGIDNVILPNNVLVKGDSFTMTIEKDMEYEVIAKDKAGNENKITIKVESDKDSSNDNLGEDSDSSNKPNNEASSNKPSSGESNNSANNDKDSNLDNSDKNNQDKADSEEDKKSDLVKDETLSEDDENSIEGNGESIIEMFSWEDINKEDKMLILMAMVIGVVGFAVMFIVVVGKKEEDDDNIEE